VTPQTTVKISLRVGDGTSAEYQAEVPAHLGPYPGLAVTVLPDGRIWRVTHLASGHRISRATFPAAHLAWGAALACGEGVDWTRASGQVCADPLARAAAARLEGWDEGRWLAAEGTR
jgi:hypothetical protein